MEHAMWDMLYELAPSPWAMVLAAVACSPDGRGEEGAKEGGDGVEG